jgi:hypothetical protein
LPELARELADFHAAVCGFHLYNVAALTPTEAQRLKGQEDENRRLKHLMTDLSLDRDVLKALIQEDGWSLPA